MKRITILPGQIWHCIRTEGDIAPIQAKIIATNPEPAQVLIEFVDGPLAGNQWPYDLARFLEYFGQTIEEAEEKIKALTASIYEDQMASAQTAYAQFIRIREHFGINDDGRPNILEEAEAQMAQNGDAVHISVLFSKRQMDAMNAIKTLTSSQSVETILAQAMARYYNDVQNAADGGTCKQITPLGEQIDTTPKITTT